MIKINFRNLAKLNLTLITVMLFTFSGLFYVFDQVYQRIFFAMTFGVLSFTLPFLQKLSFRKRGLLFALYYAFVCSFFLDAVLFLSINCVVYGLSMFSVIIIIDDVFSRCGKPNDVSFLCNVNITFGVVLLVTCILNANISVTMYKGILGNPNTLGIAAGELLVFVLAKQAEYLRQSLRLGRLEWMYVFFALFISVLTSCRTAVFGEVACLFIFFLYHLKLGNRVSKRNIAIFTTMVLLCLAYFYAKGTFSDLFLFTKQQTVLMRNGNIGNGRLEMWQLVWMYAGPFGNGETILPFAVHNVYFGLINQFGKVNGILFFLFVIEFIRRSLRHGFKKTNSQHTPWELLPALCSVYFFIVSMTENYMMTAPMVAMFISMPLITNKDFSLRGELVRGGTLGTSESSRIRVVVLPKSRKMQGTVKP